jgi:hypothetical protein
MGGGTNSSFEIGSVGLIIGEIRSFCGGFD